MEQAVLQSASAGKKMSQEEQEQNKGELFESVVAKYFEIIKTILPRISTLYLQNQQFQKNLFALESKMAKIEKDNQNLHYQMRTNHLAIDNKFNHVLADYSNLSIQFSRIKQQNDELSRELLEIKSIQTTHKQVISQRIERVQTVDKQESMEMQQRAEEAARRLFKKQKNKKITFLETYSENHQQTNQQLKNKKSLRSYDRKSSIDVDVEEIAFDLPQEATIEIKKSSNSRSVIDADSAYSNHTSKIQSQNSFDFPDRNKAIAMKSQKVMLRKTNLKSSNSKVAAGKETRKEREVSANKSQKVFVSKSADEFHSSDNYRQIRKEIQDFYEKNQSIKKNYEYLMGEYCRSSQQQYAKTQEQYAKTQEQINELKSQVAEIDTLHTHFEKIRIQLQNKIASCNKDTEIKINSKVEAKQFHQFMLQTNTRLTAIHEERRKVANKDQTKKAIEFIDRKLNHMIEEILPANEHKYPKLHFVDLEISHLTSRIAAMPISTQKNNVFIHSGERTAKNSEHTTRQATLQTYSTSNRLAESVHQKARSDKLMNDEQSELCPVYKQKTPDRNSICKNKKVNDRDSLAYLRDSSRELLSRGEKKKVRTKLKKEKMFFQYD